MAIDWGKWIEIGANVGKTTAEIAAARAKGRQEEATTNQVQDVGALNRHTADKELDLNALVDAYKAELDRAQGMLSEYETKLKAPQQRASNSVRGDLLANVRPVTVDAPPGVHVTRFSGGLSPELLSSNTRQLGTVMSKEALLSALSDDAPNPYSTTKPLDLSSITSRSAPAQTPLPQPSGVDKTMANIGTYASLGAIVAEAMRKQQQQTPTTASTLAQTPGMRPRPGLPPGVGTVVANPTLPTNPYA